MAKKCTSDNILLILTLIGVATGLASGIILKKYLIFSVDEERKKQLFIQYLGFLGELMMRSFTLVMIPVLITSIISGITNMGSGQSSKVGSRAFLYYLLTTFIAIINGIILVLIIKPGVSSAVSQNSTLTEQPFNGSMASTQVQFMDLFRNIVPSNIFAATISVDYTEIHPDFKNSSETLIGEKIFKKSTKSSPNILGLVIVAIIVAMIISKLGEKGKPLKNIIDVLNDIVMAGIMYIMWFVPFGVASLISKAIFAMDTDLEETMNQVAWYFATVFIGLMIHWFIVLPIIFFVVVRTNPYTYMLGLSRALVTAFGTSSSACTLPITMQCVENKLGIDSRISKFILPLGCTVNMDGTALMEGVAAIAISQMEGTVLTIPQICSLSITATLASIGASSIPSSGLIMLTMILTSLGVNTRHIALLWAIDWLLDRFRTVVNVVGDSIGCAVVQKLCWKELNDGCFDGNMDKSMDNTVANSTELSNAVSGTILVTPGKNVTDVEGNRLMNGYVTEVQTLVNSPEVGNEVATKV